MPRAGYDPSRAALYRPGAAESFFPDGRPPGDDALCAALSRLAYCVDTARIRRELAAIGIAAPAVLSAGGSEGLLVRGGAFAFVAFRGTEATSLRDLVVDLTAWPRRWQRRGRVHAGFAAALAPVWPAVADWLAAQGDATAVFTGHSLGGALATLAAALHGRGRLVTFGCPRVGDAAFARALAGVEAVRYVGCCDLVCRLPPPWPPFSYRHFGRLRYIDRDGRVLEAPSRSRMRRDRAVARRDYRPLARQPGNVTLRSLADHAPVNYITALR